MLAIAYGCVLIAALLPYIWVVVAKTSGQRYNNRDPRAWQARQESPVCNRANAAHLNSFEAFAPFAAGVIMAQLAQVPAERIAVLSVAFVVLRVAYGLLYVGNRHLLRSLVWTLALACVLALLVMAMLGVATAAP
ncbi:MAPEG family protein [Lysobacter niastensis]|uniref:MAPEG family protein n=1 Tax=Lysobacter niastensis TaxID=380629 RepID=UPI001E4D054B|nr:MAPEG family protein [Lysobacter niastensis]